MSAIPHETIEAEIVEEELKAPVLQDIKYPIKVHDIDMLLNEYKDIPNIDPSADVEIVAEQFKFVEAGHKRFVKARNQIEKTRKTLKAPALEYGKKVDSIAKEFQSKIIGTETALKLQRTKVEEYEAQKQREAEEAEEKRIENIKSLINATKSLPLQHFNSSSAELTKALESLRVVTKETYEEFYDEAVENQNYVISQLQTARDNKLLVENAEKLQAEADAKAKAEEAEKQALIYAEQKRLDDERAEFERQKAEFESQQRAIQEERDREIAEREADELMKRQEAERVEKIKQDKINIENAKAEAYKCIDKHLYINNNELRIDMFIQAVLDKKVCHIKWVD